MGGQERMLLQHSLGNKAAEAEKSQDQEEGSSVSDARKEGTFRLV